MEKGQGEALSVRDMECRSFAPDKQFCCPFFLLDTVLHNGSSTGDILVISPPNRARAVPPRAAFSPLVFRIERRG